MITALADLTIYSNASLKAARTGFGYVAVCNGRLLLGSGSVACGIGNSYQAEVDAAEAALDHAICRVGNGVKTVDLVISNRRVDEMFTKRRLWVVSPIGLDQSLRVFNVDPYSESSTGAAFANAVAHNLAVIGRDGEVVFDDLVLDRNWRQNLVALDQRLDPDPRPACLSGKEAAAVLGLGYDEVSEMVRDGRLAVDRRSGKILESAVKAMLPPDLAPEAEMPRFNAGRA